MTTRADVRPAAGLWWRGIVLVALAVLVIELVIAAVSTSLGYGYHRDELYFLEAGQHLAWGTPTSR